MVSSFISQQPLADIKRNLFLGHPVVIKIYISYDKSGPNLTIFDNLKPNRVFKTVSQELKIACLMTQTTFLSMWSGMNLVYICIHLSDQIYTSYDQLETK